MRKFLTLFSALLLTVSMWGAYEYDATINGDVTLTDLSYDLGGFMVYKYQLDFAQVGVNRSNGVSYNSTACMILDPLEEGIAGTYRKDDYSMNSNSYVYYDGAYRYVCDYTGKPTEIIITDNGDGSYTISGAFRTKNGSNYYYYYFDATDPKNTFTPVAPDPYPEEPEKTNLTLNSNKIDLYDFTYYYGYTEVDILNADNYEMALAFMGDVYGLPEGTYNVASTQGEGTILASTGMDGSYPNLSYYKANYSDVYFIVGGSLTVSYSQDQTTIYIVGTLMTGHESTIEVNASADNPFYVNPTYSREVTSGNYGTICLPRKFTEMTGVDGLFVPSYQDGGVLYCDEVALEEVQAGYAYIFKSNADEVTFTFNPEDVETAPVEANYMYGWLADDYELSVSDIYYYYEGYALLANNQIITPTTGSVIKKNRAMINLANVPSEAPQLAPNRRRVAFGTNVATGLEKAQGNMRTGKMMIKGNLILMKDGKKFNAQGAEL